MKSRQTFEIYGPSPVLRGYLSEPILYTCQYPLYTYQMSTPTGMKYSLNTHNNYLRSLGRVCNFLSVDHPDLMACRTPVFSLAAAEVACRVRRGEICKVEETTEGSHVGGSGRISKSADDAISREFFLLIDSVGVVQPEQDAESPFNLEDPVKWVLSGESVLGVVDWESDADSPKDFEFSVSSLTSA